MRLAVSLLALAAAVLAPTLAWPRSYTVDDLLRHEALGRVLVDSSGRWLVFEKREATLTLEQQGRVSRQDVLRSRPYLVDLAHPAAARPLVPDDQKPGTIVLGFSPAGTHLAVARLSGDRFELGTVTLTTGAIRWWPVAPSYDPFHQVVAWLSEDRLMLIGEPDDRAAGWLIQDIQPIQLAQERTRATLHGELAVTVAGSGRFFAIQPSSERRLVEVDLLAQRMTIVARGAFASLDGARSGPWLALAHQDQAFQVRTKDPVDEGTPPILERLILVTASSGTRWTPCPDCVLAGPPVWDGAGTRVAAMVIQAGVSRILVADPGRRSTILAAAPKDRSKDAGTVGCPLRWQGGLLVVPGQVAQTVADQAVRPSVGILRVSGTCAHRSWPSTGAPWQPASWYLRRGEVLVGGAGLAYPPLPWTEQTPPSAIDLVNLGPTRGMEVLRVRQRSGVEELVLAQAHQLTSLMTLNAHMRGIDPARFVPVRHGTSDEPLVSWLALPAHAKPGTKLALVIIPYAGQTYGEQPPADQAIGGERFYTSAQLLTAQGFAVLLPSLPMPATLPDTNFSFADEIDKALRAVMASGCCDAHRVALWGHSYGAYTAAMAAAQSKAYRAVIASSGIYDLAATIGTFGPRTRAMPERVLPIAGNYAWAEAGQGRMGAPPWAVTNRYVANSPIYLANRISAPMLITAADQDVSPLNQAEELFSALFRQGKDAQLVTYWGEGHVVSSPANLRDLYGRVIRFLAAELGNPAQASKAVTSRRKDETVASREATALVPSGMHGVAAPREADEGRHPHDPLPAATTAKRAAVRLPALAVAPAIR
ncbi:MAG: prolyl oligopeptidase family serine peptidase [Hyphomicrobiaceae bacterium]